MAEFIKLEFTKLTRKKLLKGFKKLSNKQEFYKKVLKVFDEIGLIAQNRAISHFLSGGRKLRRRTGSLAQSFVGGSTTYKGLPAVRVGVLKGPAAKYASVQEFGTKSKGGKLPDIVPVRAKALAVPLWSKAAGFGSNKAVTASGVSRFESPRSYPGTLKFVPLRKGNVSGLLYDENDMTKDDQGNFNPIPGQATYMLFRKVGIKPRPFAMPSLKYALQFAEDRMRNMIDDVLDKGK